MKRILRFAALAAAVAAALLASPRPSLAQCNHLGPYGIECEENSTTITDFHDSSRVNIAPEEDSKAYAAKLTKDSGRGSSGSSHAFDIEVRGAAADGAFLEILALGPSGKVLATFHLERSGPAPRPLRLAAVGSDGRAAELTLRRVGAGGTGAGGPTRAAVARVASWPNHVEVRRQKSGGLELTCGFEGGASVLIGEEGAAGAEPMASRALHAAVRAPSGRPVALTGVGFRAFRADSIGVGLPGHGAASAK